MEKFSEWKLIIIVGMLAILAFAGVGKEELSAISLAAVAIIVVTRRE